MREGGGRTRPTVVVVTGPPAAGKSTLARRLGVALAIPVVSRDTIKLSLVRTEKPAPDALRRGGEYAQRSFSVFAELIDLHVDRSISLVIEQSFERGRGEEFLGQFADRAVFVQVVCEVSKATSLNRFARRIHAEAGTRPNPTDHEILEMLRDSRIDYALFAPLELDAPTHVLGCEDIGTPDWERRVEELAARIVAVL